MPPIEETIDPGDVTSGTVTVTARLDWGGSVSLQLRRIDDGSVGAGLAVEQLLGGLPAEVLFDPSIPVPGEETVNCSSTST